MEMDGIGMNWASFPLVGLTKDRKGLAMACDGGRAMADSNDIS